jgi:TRIAD3 protein (E3 ubiquitin-protein ligase RNF216)
MADRGQCEPQPINNNGKAATVTPNVLVSGNVIDLNDQQRHVLEWLKNIFPGRTHEFLYQKVAHQVAPELNTIIDVVLASSPTSTGGGLPSQPKRPRLDPDSPVASTSKVADDEEEKERLVKITSDRFEDILPNVDPSFLHDKAKIFVNKSPNEVDAFILECLEDSTTLPKREVYEKRLKQEEELQRFSSMKPKDMLEMYNGNPVSHFYNVTDTMSPTYTRNTLEFLKKELPKHMLALIRRVLATKNGHYLPTLRELKEKPGTRKHRRGIHEYDVGPPHDSRFLQEMIFGTKEKELVQYQADETLKRQAAVVEKAFFTCDCCFDDEILILDVLECDLNHMFCPSCVSRGIEVQIGDGKERVTCLSTCEGSFSMTTLKSALKPVVFSRYLQRLQLAEVKAAGVEGLEQCPHCDFATIITNPNDKVFTCLNPECGRHTCRMCKEQDHVPLACDEVERDVETKARTQFEDALTEAMVRECWNCKTRFYKDEGCNKMTCPKCKCKMCYICRKKVSDYSHFYGQGAEPVNGKCALYTDTNSLHASEVNKAAEEKKKEMEAKNITLKNDPTKDLSKPREDFNVAEVYVPPMAARVQPHFHNMVQQVVPIVRPQLIAIPDYNPMPPLPPQPQQRHLPVMDRPLWGNEAPGNL